MQMQAHHGMMQAQVRSGCSFAYHKHEKFGKQIISMPSALLVSGICRKNLYSIKAGTTPDKKDISKTGDFGLQARFSTRPQRGTGTCFFKKGRSINIFANSMYHFVGSMRIR